MDVNSRRTDKNYAATRLPENGLLVCAQRHVHTHIVYTSSHTAIQIIKYLIAI